MNSTPARLIITIISVLQSLQSCLHILGLEHSNRPSSGLLSENSEANYRPFKLADDELVNADSMAKNTDFGARKRDQDSKIHPARISRTDNSTSATLESKHMGIHKNSGRPVKDLIGGDLGLGILGGSENHEDEWFTGGWATYFTQNSIPGACGKVHQDSDVIVALDYRRYGPLSKISKHCGRTVEITSGLTTMMATVADACPTCLNKNCLDLSEGAFKLLGITIEEGMRAIAWRFL